TSSEGQYTGFREQLLQGHAALISAEQFPEAATISYQTMILGVPIIHNQRLLGVMMLDRSANTPSHVAQPSRFHFRREFSIWDIAVAEGIAQFAGLAIEQARWQQEAEMAHSNAASMRASSELKDEFLAITAHDFRTPLSIIQGHSQMMGRHLRKNGDIAPEL